MYSKKLTLLLGAILVVGVSASVTYADGILVEDVTTGNNTFATGQPIGSLTAFIQVQGSRAIAAEIGGQASADFYRVTLTAGQMIMINVNTPGGPTLVNDPVLGLFNPAGTLVAFNDDCGAPGRGFDSCIPGDGTAFLVPTTGLWGVAVSGFADFNFVGGGSNGWPYELNICVSGTPCPTGFQRPIPEPATMLLLGSGLAGLAGLRRRRKSNP
jgi:PEP-CTERM motif